MDQQLHEAVVAASFGRPDELLIGVDFVAVAAAGIDPAAVGKAVPDGIEAPAIGAKALGLIHALQSRVAAKLSGEQPGTRPQIDSPLQYLDLSANDVRCGVKFADLSCHLQSPIRESAARRFRAAAGFRLPACGCRRPR